VTGSGAEPAGRDAAPGGPGVAPGIAAGLAPGLAPQGLRHAGMRSHLSRMLAIAVIAGQWACGGDGGHERVPLGQGGIESPVDALPGELQAQLDSGNAAYRAGDHQVALYHFQQAVRIEPDLAAGWYGVGMTQSALGNAPAADSAMARVHRLAPTVPLQHPSTDAPPNPHPPSGGATPR
jgi:tetratricopeptide (TPR) repeat protein